MNNAVNHDKMLDEQIAYYRARAGEYDQWFLRQGRYDRGPELNRRWFDEIAVLRRALADFNPRGDVLELACGTGLWTIELLQYADRITAVDAADEVLAINREKARSSRVAYLQADLFTWKPQKKYDAVFFSFWLSHVPPERFEAFWLMVAGALKPDGRCFFIDSQYESTSTAKDHRLNEKESTTVTRQLNDGRQFQLVKIFYETSELSQRLFNLGWDCRLDSTGSYFYYGQSQPRPQALSAI